MDLPPKLRPKPRLSETPEALGALTPGLAPATRLARVGRSLVGAVGGTGLGGLQSPGGLGSLGWFVRPGLRFV